MTPARLTRPNVGLNPVTPQMAAGVRIDPSVSVPMLNPTTRARHQRVEIQRRRYAVIEIHRP
jgi:hypothetical protein